MADSQTAPAPEVVVDVAAPVTPQAPGSELQPSKASSFEDARKSRLRDWLTRDADEVLGEEPSEVATEPESVESVQEQAALPVDPPTPVAEGGIGTGEEAGQGEVETPTRETEVVAAPQSSDAQPTPKHFSAKVGEAEFQVPDGLVVTYKADGQDRARPIEEVIKFAQLGENFNRRSQELAEKERQLGSESEKIRTQASQEIQAAWTQFWDTAKKFAEDAEYREEFLDEYTRLKENPEEVQLRIKANRADELEKILEEQKSKSAEDYNRQVWTTVDQIIAAQTSGTGAFPYANPERIKQQFYAAYQQVGTQALSDTYLIGLIQQDHEAIEKIVTAERARALAQTEDAVKRAKAQATVETQNRIVDKSLQREQVAATVVTGGQTAATQKAPQISSARDASKALRDWANR